MEASVVVLEAASQRQEISVEAQPTSVAVWVKQESAQSGISATRETRDAADVVVALAVVVEVAVVLETAETRAAPKRLRTSGRYMLTEIWRMETRVARVAKKRRRRAREGKETMYMK